MGGYICAGPRLNFLPSVGFTTGLTKWKVKADDVDKNSRDKTIKVTEVITTAISEVSIAA